MQNLNIKKGDCVVGSPFNEHGAPSAYYVMDIYDIDERSVDTHKAIINNHVVKLKQVEFFDAGSDHPLNYVNDLYEANCTVFCISDFNAKYDNDEPFHYRILEVSKLTKLSALNNGRYYLVLHREYKNERGWKYDYVINSIELGIEQPKGIYKLRIYE